MRFVTVSKARGELPLLVESIDRVVLTKNGEPMAVLLHLDDYRAMRAMQRLATQPDRLAAALSAHERVQRGDLDGLPELQSESIGAIAEPEPSYGEESSAPGVKRRLLRILARLRELGEEAAEIGEHPSGLDEEERQLAIGLQKMVAELHGRFRGRPPGRGRKKAG
jgi:prevent-host-death family protein